MAAALRRPAALTALFALLLPAGGAWAAPAPGPKQRLAPAPIASPSRTGEADEVAGLRARVAKLETDKRKLALAARNTLAAVRQAEEEEKRRRPPPPPARGTLQYELQHARAAVGTLEKVVDDQKAQISALGRDKQSLLASVQRLMSFNSSADADVEAQQSRQVDDAVEATEERHAREESATEAKLTSALQEKEAASEAMRFMQSQEAHLSATIAELRGTNGELLKAKRGMELRLTDGVHFLEQQLREAESNTTAAVTEARQFLKLDLANTEASKHREETLADNLRLAEDRAHNVTRVAQMLELQNQHLVQEDDDLRGNDKRVRNAERDSEANIEHQLRLAELRAARAEAQNAIQAKTTLGQLRLEANLSAAEERATNATNEVQELEAENEHVRAEAENLRVEVQNLKSAGLASEGQLQGELHVAELRAEASDAKLANAKPYDAAAPDLKSMLRAAEERAANATNSMRSLQAQNDQLNAEAERLRLANENLKQPISNLATDAEFRRVPASVLVPSALLVADTAAPVRDEVAPVRDEAVATVPGSPDPIAELAHLGAELRRRLRAHG